MSRFFSLYFNITRVKNISFAIQRTLSCNGFVISRFHCTKLVCKDIILILFLANAKFCHS